MSFSSNSQISALYVAYFGTNRTSLMQRAVESLSMSVSVCAYSFRDMDYWSFIDKTCWYHVDRLTKLKEKCIVGFGHLTKRLEEIIVHMLWVHVR